MNVFGREPGAVLDVKLEGADAARVVASWRREAARVLDAVGWSASKLAARVSGPDLSLFLTASRDVLYAATEVNELAWTCADAVLAGEPEPSLSPAIDEVRRSIAEETNPRLLTLEEEAARRGVAFLADDRDVSFGMGEGSAVFPIAELPDPGDVPWSRVHDVPVVMITGTNGKTTTARLLGSIVAADGRTPGISTTDGLKVGREAIGTGDYSGPEGARKILRDPRVGFAILETARGGIQRRGLALSRIDAAAITNVAEDHLGEFGMHTLDDVAEFKLVVARALPRGAPLVLGAGDVALTTRARAAHDALAFFSIDSPASEGDAAWVEGGRLVVRRAGRRRDIVGVEDVPATFAGLAKHNVANALTATMLAAGLDLDDAAIASGLSSFASGPEENPGRANLLTIGGIKVLVDFAHNPHGMEALVAFARAIPASRRLVVIGQAGDRDDGALRAMARAAWGLAPDLVVLKEMTAYLRGRAPGEIPRILEDELRLQGASPEQIVHASSEVEAVTRALAWARDGDLLVLPTHSDRKEVTELIRSRTS
ncbi:MAG TPA: Mur ligase family protein [Candidatus Polarisedimenticolaceae bacterium]|nr:Mur ligase family protein [Candidatus Polarisedimenticolaceae bacterium]